MKRWLRVFGITTLLVFILGAGVGATAAHADEDTPSSWQVTKYHQNVELSADGVATVTLELDFDFGSDEGHGPYIYLPIRQEVKDPNQWLDIGVDVVSVTSPSGANSDVKLEANSDALMTRIGSQGSTYTGVQSYVIVYKVSGLVAQNQAESGLDEFNWSTIGKLWDVPIHDVAVTVTGPADITKAACFYGDSYQNKCESQVSGKTATYSTSRVSVGSGVQVVAGFPAGTFTGVTQQFSKRYTLENMFPLTPATGVGTALLTIGGYALIRLRLRRSMADRVYLGMTPGATPMKGEAANVGIAGKLPPVAVAFTPPKGSRPGEIGTLFDATVDNVDLTATVLDLAVRGYIKIDPMNGQGYSFTKLAKGQEKLVEYERAVMEDMFAYQSVVSTEDLKSQKYADILSNGRSNLSKRVVELGWFRSRPELTRVIVIAAAVGCAVLGAVIGFAGAWFGWGLLGLSGIIVGALLFLSSGKFTARTAEGSAVLYQAKGFELYLATAEANQIKFEEGIDVFSRYLPYAAIFGLTERWVKIFKELDEAGIYHPATTWYGGNMGFNMFDFWMFSHVMSDLSSSMDHAVSSASTAGTSGSFGGSGFSGGGGFGGGGGGGW